MGTSDIRLADLTGRARIREAGLHLFAAEGYAQTSLRSIAQRAHVSLALIAHHFGSKHQLRDAIDAWVLSLFQKAAGDASEGTATDEGACRAFTDAIGDIMSAHPEIRGYLRRMIVVDAAPNGMALLGSLLTLACSIKRKSPRPCSERELAAQSLQFLLLALGPALLEPVLLRFIPGLFAESGARAHHAPELQTVAVTRVAAPASAADTLRPVWFAAHG